MDFGMIKRRLQYTSSARDHTSQDTGQVFSLYTFPASLSQIAAPPPAHEDPNEEKTFTVLLSKDISDGLIPAEPLSPCREVLGLSPPQVLGERSRTSRQGHHDRRE